MGKRIPRHVGTMEGERAPTTILHRRRSVEEYHKQTIRTSIRGQKLSRRRFSPIIKAVVGQKQPRLRPAKEFMNNAMRKVRIERRINLRVMHPAKQRLTTSVTNKPLLAIRVKGSTDLSRKAKTLLRKFRLTRLYDAVLVLGTEETLRSMHILKEYVSIGSLPANELHDLIKHYAKYKDNKKNILPLSNRAVEQYLGQHSLLCVEDLIDVLQQGKESPFFSEVARFLRPFRFALPESVERRDTERNLFEKRNRISRSSLAQYYLNQFKQKKVKKGNNARR